MPSMLANAASLKQTVVQHDGEAGGPANVSHSLVECLGVGHGGNVGAPGGHADRTGGIDSRLNREPQQLA
eukprot:7479007-Pyramimonas_sp.AAC.1